MFYLPDGKECLQENQYFGKPEETEGSSDVTREMMDGDMKADFLTGKPAKFHKEVSKKVSVYKTGIEGFRVRTFKSSFKSFRKYKK